MCYDVQAVLWDVLVVIAVVLLILWILSLTGVSIIFPVPLENLKKNNPIQVIFVHTGPIIHVFIALAILFAIVWLFVRFCYKGRVTTRRGTIV